MPPVSSTDTELTTTTTEGVSTPAPETSAPESANAEPPAADQGSKTPATMLDAVKAAVEKSAGEESPASKGDEQESDSTDPDAESAEEGDPDEFTEEETARLHSKTRRRVKKLVATNKALSGELEEIRPLADQMQRVATFVRESGLTFDEVNEGFTIMRLMKQEPAKAYDALLPFMASLEEVLGKRLPADLNEKVRQGYVTQDVAAELAQTRARAAQASSQVQNVQRVNAANQHRAMVNDLTGAMTQFENDWKKSDPDYAAKQPLVQERFELEMLKAIRSGNPPRTAKEAIALAEKCRKEVSDRIRTLVPQKPREVRPVTGGSSAAAAPAPQSTLDVVRMAVGQR